ncbi:hypothetical protein SAY87_027568 [Trapa incisa]|uniref:FLZ-type domain-containing protein n=1 Tax=Trapa incisa TaxID=236973 RepID=A0AAN7JMM6_9MYRT|nr:hypothetical protein SAY87_027568 [Trapa incisa]
MAADEPTRTNSTTCFSLPRLFTAFNPSSDNEPVISPTSILESKPFSRLKASFWSETSTPRTAPEPDNKMLVVGSLGLVEVLEDDEPPLDGSNPSKMVLFGSQLRIQVPSLPASHALPSSLDSPRSPTDFGIKTRNSQPLSPSPLKQPTFILPTNTAVSYPGPMSVSEIAEMELSEDYTCVTLYGPNPKTVHIFGDCIVKSCSGDDQFSSPPKPPTSFLSSCQLCKKSLGPGNDIYMYRGEMAFCSSECRYEEMLKEERLGKIEP